MKRLRRLLSYVWPYRFRAAATFACMLVLAAMTAVYAFLVGPLLALLVTGDVSAAASPTLLKMLPTVDAGTIDRGRFLVALPLFMVSVAVVKGLAYVGQFYLMGTLGQSVVADMRKELFAKLVSLPPAFYAKRHTGDLQSRLNLDVQHVEQAITLAVASYLRDSLQVLVLLVQSFVIDWELSLIAFGAVPVMVVPLLWFTNWLKRVTRRRNVATGQLAEVTQEALTGIRVVQAFGMEAKERARYAEATETYLAVMARSLLVRGTSTPTMEVLAVAGLGAAVAFASGRIGAGEIDGQHFLSFVATVLLLYQPAKSLGRMGEFMVQGLTSAERVFEILDTESEIADRPDARVLGRVEGTLAFEHVSFEYAAPDGGPPRKVLDGIDLRASRGEVVALVGASGAGKSTLVNLVPRFYDPTGGRITLDGTDLRDVTLASLRANLAVVTQETVLFNESVAANVAYGRPGATQAEVEAAARVADAHDFILALPQGYATRVGEKGVLLSGGQRQRLAIARAVLKDAPILILDEATSSLDAHSEAEVQAALDKLMAGRTVLVVAHRLSTVRNAHRIVVLSGGRVVEEGTHDALLAKNGEYARLVALQRGAGA